MKQVVLAEPGLLSIKQGALPSRCEGHVLIKVLRVGICGTDYHAFRGKQPFFHYPRILGHEIAGEICEIDEHSRGLQVGDQVTILPYLSCGHCIACKNGKPNACVSLQVFGVHIDGGLQQYVSVPVEQVIRTEQISLDQTAVIEPLSIGLHAVNRANVRGQETILVIGAGPIGLAVMKFAKLAGGRVIAMDMNQERLTFSQKWANTDDVINAATEDINNRLAELTAGDYPAVVIDATGHAGSMMNAIHYAAHGGRVIYVSLVQADISFSDPLFHKKELTLMGSRAATKAEFEFVIECLEQNQIDAERYLTHHAAFDQVIEAFGAWLDPDSSVIKAVLHLEENQENP
jgi:2-desacetyl-2-hydroxyethyl bacteriochlorophyllide A dehydrogenase